MAARPIVSVYGTDSTVLPDKGVHLPAVFKAPIRPDIVSFVHDKMLKNSRQPYSVNVRAGKQSSAASWGTGRAVARIPRVRGGGTHRSGQGAFGNMCRGGRMFAPTKTWRRWHHRINTNQKRYAMCSAIAATGVPALVMSKGHKIEEIAEVPLVVEDKIESIQKTKEAVSLLRQVKAWKDVEKVCNSKRFRAGKGKMRNRRRIMRTGPCVIYSRDDGIRKAFRNIPGISLLNVEKLNLRALAPGGHVGRFCIWSESAMGKLDALYGTWSQASALKTDYNLPQPMLTNTDLSKLLQSQEIQAALRPKKAGSTRTGFKRNPLKNAAEMAKLDPFSVAKKRAALVAEKDAALAKDEAKKRKGVDADGKASQSKRTRRLALEEAEKKRLAAEEEAAAKRVALKDQEAKAKAAKDKVPKKKKAASPKPKRKREPKYLIEKEEPKVAPIVPVAAAAVAVTAVTVPEVAAVVPPSAADPVITTYPTPGFEEEVKDVLEPPVAVSPDVEDMETDESAGEPEVEDEVAVCPPAVEPEVIVCAPEPEVAICPVVVEPDAVCEPEAEVPVCLPVEEPAVEISAPEPEVAVCPPSVEMDAAVCDLEPEVAVCVPVEDSVVVPEPEVAVCPMVEEPQVEIISPEPEVAVCPPVLEGEIAISSPEPEITICPPVVEIDAAVVVPEPEVLVCPPVAEIEAVVCAPEPEVAVCPPEEEPAVEIGIPEPEVAVCPPMAEIEAVVCTQDPEVAVCPPVEEPAVDICIPEPEVAVGPPVEEEEADAFDFFSPEPIGSKARDLERELELAAMEASTVTTVTSVTTTSEVTILSPEPEIAVCPTIADPEVAVCPPVENEDVITTYPSSGLETEVAVCLPVVEPEVAVCPPVSLDASITTYPADGLEQEVIFSHPVTEPEVAVCPPVEMDATITTYPAGGLETEVPICVPDLDLEVAVCPPMEVDSTINTLPAAGLEQEIVINLPVTEPEVAVCPPVEVDETITTYPAAGLETVVSASEVDATIATEVAVCPPIEDVTMEEEDEADAFDYFSPEPIGSKARDLEREQELAAYETSKVTATSSETFTAEGSTWVTETESVIITTTTTTITTTDEDGVVSEKKEVNISSTGGDIQTMEVVEPPSCTDMVAASTEAVIESSIAAETAVAAEAAVVYVPSEVVTPIAAFYTEELRSVSGEPQIVEEEFRVVGPHGAAVPEDVLEEAGHPEKQ